VCDLENLKNEEAMTRVGSQRHKKNKYMSQYISRNIAERVSLKLPWRWMFIWWSSV